MIIDWVWGTRFSPMQSGLFAGKPGRGSGQFSMCIRFSNWAYLIYLHIFTYIWTWRFSSISTYQYGNSPDPPRPPRLLETFLIGLPHGSHRTTSQHRDCTSWAGGDGRAGHHQKIQKQWRDEVVYCQQEWGYKTSQNESVLWEEALRGSKTLHVSLTQWPNIDQLWLTWCRILRSLLKAGTGTTDSPKFRLAFVWFTGRDG